MPQTKALSGVKITNAEQGQVEALFATFNVKDHDDDVTLPGAFDDGAKVRISAYNHASWGPAMLPVGKGTIRVTDEGPVLDGQFFMNTQAGRDTFEVVKQLEDLGEWSYGYDILDASEGQLDGEPVQFLKRLKVHEVSPVLLGAGIGTRTMGTKGKQLDSEICRRLEEAAAARYGQSPDTYSFVLDFDVDESYAILCVYGPDQDRTLRVSFTRQDGNVVLLPGEQEVERSVTYEPKSAGPDGTKATGEPETKGAIPYKHTDTTDAAWDGPAAISGADGESDLRAICAWVDSDGDPDAKSSYKFPHHASADAAANVKACSAVIAVLNGGRGGADIPDGDREGVYNHVAHHLRDAGEEPAELKSLDELKATPPPSLADALLYLEELGEKGADALTALTAAMADVGLPGEQGKKLADHLDETIVEIETVTTRVADAVAQRAENGQKLAEGTLERADRLKAAIERLREALAIEPQQEPKADDRGLTLDDESRFAENLARSRLSL